MHTTLESISSTSVDELTYAIPLSEEAIVEVAFSATGTFLFTRTPDFLSANILDLTTRETISISKTEVHSYALSPTDDTVAIWDSMNVLLFDLKTGVQLFAVPGDFSTSHSGSQVLTFSDDGNYLFVAEVNDLGMECVYHIWKLGDSQSACYPLPPFTQSPRSRIHDVGQNRYLFQIGSGNGISLNGPFSCRGFTLRVLNLDTKEELLLFDIKGNPEIAHDGKLVLFQYTSSRNNYRCLSIPAMEIVSTSENALNGQGSRASLCDKGRLIAIDSRNPEGFAKVAAHNTMDGNPVSVLSTQIRGQFRVVSCPKSSRVAVSSADDTGRCYTVITSMRSLTNSVHTTQHNWAAHHSSFSPCGRWFVSSVSNIDLLPPNYPYLPGTVVITDISSCQE